MRILSISWWAILIVWSLFSYGEFLDLGNPATEVGQRAEAQGTVGWDRIVVVVRWIAVLAIVRVIMESIVIIFRIHQRLLSIDEKLGDPR